MRGEVGIEMEEIGMVFRWIKKLPTNGLVVGRILESECSLNIIFENYHFFKRNKVQLLVLLAILSFNGLNLTLSIV